MEQFLDLHMHTKNSDGQYYTSWLMDILQQHDLQYFSITDHDNIDSVKDMRTLEHKGKYIPGVELSSIIHDHYRIHILGYGFDENSQPMSDLCALLKEKRIRRFRLLAKALYDKHGIEISQQEIEDAIEVYHTPGRPHLSRIMIRNGYVNSTNEAFEKYLQDINADIINEADARISIETIKKAGGYAIWAHPVKCEREYQCDFTKLMPDLKAYGLDGLEIGNCLHSYSDYQRFLDYCKKENLLTSAGSDYHGPKVKPHAFIGQLFNDHPEIEISPQDISLLKVL